MESRAFGGRISLLAVFSAFMFVAVNGFCQQPQSSQAGPIIVLTSLNAPEDDTLATKLADTITSSIELVMRLAGGVVVKRADFLTPSLSLQRAELYYKQEGAAGAVFGSVVPASGGAYVATLDIWSSSRSSENPVSFKRTIENPLEIFDISDELSLMAGSSVVGRALTSGTLVLKNTGYLSHYSVYVDGELLGRDRTSFQVLTGPRRIVVAKPGGPLGDEPVEEFEVLIHDHQTTEVTLTEKPKIAAQAPSGGSQDTSAAGNAGTPSSGDRALLPTFEELNSQFTTLRTRDLPYALAFWGSYSTVLTGVIVGTSGPTAASSSSLTPQGAIGLGIGGLGLTGMLVTWIIDPLRSNLKDSRLKVSGLPILSYDQTLEELKSELKSYRSADLPYTLTYWGSFVAIIGGVVLAASAQDTVNPDGTTRFNVQRAAGLSVIYLGLGGMIGSSAADPYHEGIRQLRRKIRTYRKTG